MNRPIGNTSDRKTPSLRIHLHKSIKTGAFGRFSVNLMDLAAHEFLNDVVILQTIVKGKK